MSKQRALRADPRGPWAPWAGAACLLLVPVGAFGAHRELVSASPDLLEATFAALTALMGSVLGFALLAPRHRLKWWPLGVAPLALGFLCAGLVLLWDPASAVNTEFANSRRNSEASVTATGVFLLLLGAGGLAASVMTVLPRPRRRPETLPQAPAPKASQDMTPKQRRRARKRRNRTSARH
ncbi:hypothetical protein [Nocardiopsis ganjiahuensis]|uniref:hypothetical protein n=1 Tax=Nocardiopsis ganjiahuensis TaxID=239984 RepID=UPI0003499625|nr:hypothetical protein [Nocardiopsis ganjiahuensis]